MKKLNTQLAYHFQITYYKLIHGRHKTPLQIMMTILFWKNTK